MTAFTQSEQALEYQTVKDCSGWGPATEEIRKLPFGEISWPVSGNESIAEVIGQIPSGSFGRRPCGNSQEVDVEDGVSRTNLR